MSKNLSVIEIERFAVHDGPGIRTTVFLQGCPLHCWWCSNPESQACKAQLLYDKRKCIGCGRCYNSCNYGAIEMIDKRPVFYREKCVGCRACEKACLTGAINFSSKEMTPQEVVDIVIRDKHYYEITGGGLTVSGGEAFVQFDGFLRLIKLAKDKGLHVAVETCGQYKLSLMQQALPYIDLFLFDLKHIDRNKLYTYTGGNLDTILENISYIAANAPEKLQLRVPIIPDFNNDYDTMRVLFDKIIEIGLNEVQLLPYHILGIGKYSQLDKEYEMDCRKSLLKEELNEFVEMGKSKGIIVRVD